MELKIFKDKHLRDAWEVRNQVFTLEQGVPEQIDFDGTDNLPGVTSYVIYDGELPVGCIRSIKTPDFTKLSRIAVIKEYRGKGIGAMLVNHVLDMYKDDYVYLCAQIRLVDYYKKFGFHTEGEEYEEAGMKHIRMVK